MRDMHLGLLLHVSKSRMKFNIQWQNGVIVPSKELKLAHLKFVNLPDNNFICHLISHSMNSAILPMYNGTFPWFQSDRRLLIINVILQPQRLEQNNQRILHATNVNKHVECGN